MHEMIKDADSGHLGQELEVIAPASLLNTTIYIQLSSTYKQLFK